MILIERLQAYLRHSAQQQYNATQVLPFTIFCHPQDDFPSFNYAIPDEPVGEDLQEALEGLRAEFVRQKRQPRFEFIEEYAPQLAPALQKTGFEEESRTQFMLCTPESYRRAPLVAGLSVIRLSADSSLAEVQQLLTTRDRGFNPQKRQEASLWSAASFLRGLGSSGAFVGHLDGEAAGVAFFTTPYDGLTELVAIATLAPFRRQGIATALTSEAVQAAFAQGVELACLSAADERAGRIYKWVGFRPYATMLAYKDS